MVLQEIKRCISKWLINSSITHNNIHILYLITDVHTDIIYGNVKVLVAQSCPTLCSLMDCSPQGSSVHGILQARILEWVAIPFSRGSSQPRDQTWVSCTTGRFLTIWATREVPCIICIHVFNNRTIKFMWQKLTAPKEEINTFQA